MLKKHHHNIDGKMKMRIPSFKIPNSADFPEEYRDGTIKVGTWSSPGTMSHVLDREDGLARLEEWAVNNILIGFIAREDGCSEADLREEVVYIKVISRDGRVLLDSFDWDKVEPDTEYVQPKA